MKIAMTGANGFVGQALRSVFEVVAIKRDDTSKQILSKLDGVEAVINLAGAPIIKRWSEPYKKVLMESRIKTTAKLVEAINQSEVKQLISTSAIGIYPNTIECDESCEKLSEDFLGELAKHWESEALKCQKKVTILRFGVVLGVEGGALATMLTPFKLGVGGTIGDGKMMTSWIDIKDLIRIYHFVINHQLEGVYNAVSPNPVNNYTLTKALGEVLHRPTYLPVPIFALKLLYGEASSVLTDSKTIYPKRLLESGFVFEYDTINASLKHLLEK